MSEGTKPKRKLNDRSVRYRVKRALQLQEKGKIAYAEAERLIREAACRRARPGLVDIGTGTLYEIVDQFAEAADAGEDLVWTHSAAHRYKLRKVSKRTSEALKQSA